uniref:V-type proton ATPase subunit a n=1 Tax=Macrostomum lignano TaxID=282301 RepID=A0A1I8FGZ5_9PLAT
LVSLRGDGDATRTASDTTAVDGGDSSNNGGSDIGGLKHLQFESVAGVILRERLPAFERMLWASLPGQRLPQAGGDRHGPGGPGHRDKVLKSVFIIFFQGEQLKTRVKKICEGFRATLYPCRGQPGGTARDGHQRDDADRGRSTPCSTPRWTIDASAHGAAKTSACGSSRSARSKPIYHTLNMFNVEATNKCLIAEAWCAVDDLDKIHLALRRGTERGREFDSSYSQPDVHQGDAPNLLPGQQADLRLPEHHRRVRRGVLPRGEPLALRHRDLPVPVRRDVRRLRARHADVPGCALWMVLREKQLAPTAKLSEIWATFFNGRYIILMMGAFSIYTGLIYNDCFSSVRGQFNQSLTPDQIRTQVRGGIESLQAEPPKATPRPKAWRPTPTVRPGPGVAGVRNKITFTEQHQDEDPPWCWRHPHAVGVFVSLTNHLCTAGTCFVARCEFVPQVLFLLGMFGYLVILILYKWAVYSGRNSNCAPNLLIGLINMFLFRYEQSHERLPANLPRAIRAADLPGAAPHPLRSLDAASQAADSAPPCSRMLESMVEIKLRLGMGSRQDGRQQYSMTAIRLSIWEPDMGMHGEEVDIGEVFVHQAIHRRSSTAELHLQHPPATLRLWAPVAWPHASCPEVAVGHGGWPSDLKREGFGGCLALFVAFSFWALLTVGCAAAHSEGAVGISACPAAALGGVHEQVLQRRGLQR